MTKQTTISGFAAYDKSAVLKPFEYTPRPIGEKDVEIKISCCGICHSDIHTITSGWGAAEYPVIPGHEIVGVVTQKGDKVDQLNVGDRVGVGAMVWSCLDKQNCRECKEGFDNVCNHRVFTYNAKYSDGGVAYGGYAQFVRIQQDWAFKVPEKLSDEKAAPLLCAGVTVYAPLKRHGAKPGAKVGIVGIGGLGHLALQFANKLGAEVTAISTSTSKSEEAKKLGATNFLNIKSEDDVKKYTGYFDLILNTASGGAELTMTILNLLRPTGTCVLLGLPEEGMQIHGFPLIAAQRCMVGSVIGSIAEVKETLSFAAEHGVEPWISVMPMNECNEGVKQVIDNKARYRIVLKN